MKKLLGTIVVRSAAIAGAQTLNPAASVAKPHTFTVPLVNPGGALAPVNAKGAPTPPGGTLASAPVGGMLAPAPIGGTLNPRSTISAYAQSNVPATTNPLVTNPGVIVEPIVPNVTTTPAGGTLSGAGVGGTPGVIVTGAGANPSTTTTTGSGVIVTGGNVGGSLNPNGEGGALAPQGSTTTTTTTTTSTTR